jgi:Mor family transcriptional regulator
MSNGNHWWEGRDAIQAFGNRMVSEYGQATGEAIVRALYEEAGGMRLRVPTLSDLERQQRDDRIRILFNGRNHQELAARFGITDTHVRRILEKG